MTDSASPTQQARQYEAAKAIQASRDRIMARQNSRQQFVKGQVDAAKVAHGQRVAQRKAAFSGLGAIPFLTRTPAGVVTPLKNAYPAGRAGFIAWLKDKMPTVYDKLYATRPDTMAGLGDAGDDAATSILTDASLDSFSPSLQIASDSTSTPGWASALSSIIPAVVQGVNQQKILSLQLTRAQQGLPPLDVSAYTDDASIKGGLDASTRQMLLIAALILGGAFVAHAVIKK